MAFAVPTLLRGSVGLPDVPDGLRCPEGYRAEHETRGKRDLRERGMRRQAVQTAWLQQRVGLYGATGDALFHQ